MVETDLEKIFNAFPERVRIELAGQDYGPKSEDRKKPIPDEAELIRYSDVVAHHFEGIVSKKDLLDYLHQLREN